MKKMQKTATIPKRASAIATTSMISSSHLWSFTFLRGFRDRAAIGPECSAGWGGRKEGTGGELAAGRIHIFRAGFV
jgi:hypothetical protein